MYGSSCTVSVVTQEWFSWHSSTLFWLWPRPKWCPQFVLSTGNGVNGFTLDPGLGEFILTHTNLTVCSPECEKSEVPFGLCISSWCYYIACNCCQMQWSVEPHAVCHWHICLCKLASYHDVCHLRVFMCRFRKLASFTLSMKDTHRNGTSQPESKDLGSAFMHFLLLVWIVILIFGYCLVSAVGSWKRASFLRMAHLQDHCVTLEGKRWTRVQERLGNLITVGYPLNELSDESPEVRSTARTGWN